MAQQGIEEAQTIRTERQAEGASASTEEAFSLVREGVALIVRKNGGADVGSRPRINLIEGANITLTIVDDNIQSEVDITIALSANPDISGEYRVNANKVMGARKTGWGTPAGTLSRAAYTGITAAALPVGAAYSQSEVTALRDAVITLSQVLAALLTDLHSATSGHGAIGT